MAGSATSPEFRLLGPLEVWREGRPLRLGGERQRALLALLLLHANEVVPRERLIEELFGGGAAESGANALHVGISRLRRLLGSGGTSSGRDDVVVTRPPGYLLRAEPEQLDVALFERLLSQGGRALSAGDAASAAATLREALALWRGPALADLALLEFAQPEIRRLEELRLSALMERIEADLALGRAGDLVPELEALVDANPLQERLRGQLMLALYRSGRQADALEAYRQTRKLLREELGLEPSKALQELERSILIHDPALRPSELPVGNLPVPPTPLIGRQRAFDELAALLVKSETRLVTLTGPGGSGKTRLALELAAQLERELELPAFFVELAPLAEPRLVLSVIARTLGFENSGLAPLGETLATFLRNRRLLLVLDNFEHLLEASSDVARLLAAAPGVTILATSRSPLRLRAEARYEIGPLPPADALALFVERARAAGAAFASTPDTEETCRSICRRLDGLPLAIELAAARVDVISPATLLDRLNDRLPLPSAGLRDLPERQRTLRATVDWSCELLTPSAQRLFARLAVFAGGCTLEAAEQVCDAEPEALASLVDANLLRFDGDRFSMLETIRTVAEARFEELPEAGRVRCAHASYFADLAARADERHVEAPAVERRRKRARDAADFDNLRRAFEWTVRQGERELALRLVGDGPLPWAGTIPDGRRLLETALALTGGNSLTTEANALQRAADLAYEAGDYQRSRELLEESLKRYRTLADAAGEAVTLVRLGVSEGACGAVEQARAYFREATELSRKVSARDCLAAALHNLGELERDHGRYMQAAEFLEEALQLREAAQDEFRAAFTRHGLADLRLEQGDREPAEKLYREALAVFRLVNDERSIAYALGGLAATAAARGELERAGRIWGAVERVERERGARLRSFERSRYTRFLTTLDAEALSQEIAIGHSLDLHEVVEYAFADPSGDRGEGPLVSATEATRNATRHVHDPLGSTTKVTAPHGRETRATYESG